MLIQKLKREETIFVRGEGYMKNISGRPIRLGYEGPVTVRVTPEMQPPKLET
jgi:hypothetical protein